MKQDIFPPNPNNKSP
ncbi:hypothetical protein CP09DC80_1023A, partial [Chlamydia psittaci 09DC80]